MDSSLISAGYEALIEQYSLKTMPHYRKSYISQQGLGKSEIKDSIEIHIFSKHYLPKQNPTGNLEFALKYDGINLEILKAVFLAMDVNELTNYIKKHPTGKYARKLWFLYEFLMKKNLDIPDLKQGNYIELLPEKDYFVSKGKKSSRHKVNNNLLGTCEFSPLVRKTKRLSDYAKKNLSEKSKEIIKHYPEEIVNKANQFLYLKETKSSFEIEREKPSLNRANKFINALKNASKIDLLNKQILIELQNMIVDPRFSDSDYRNTQNYVGEVLAGYRQKIHYISPKPNDVENLMGGFEALTDNLLESKIDPVVAAALCAFSFVFIHPFEDGNGRIHRFLIHYVLSKLEFTPGNIIFPVSATMLSDLKAYDACLESFSAPLLERIEYTLDDDGKLSVDDDTIDYYRYFDVTKMSEYLYACVDKTITTDLIDELEFLIHFSAAKQGIQAVLDLPDKEINLIIKLMLDNAGNLSKTKRERVFKALTDNEITKIEQIVQKSFRPKKAKD